ncbi:MAG: hypothetical protein R8J84_07310 [Mariprofundales bacterium]
MHHNMRATLLALLATTATATTAFAATPTIISLTQTGCQFIEPEATNHHFITRRASDCAAINDRTGKQRLAQSKPLRLAAGEYIFRIQNRDVPYPLGFWLRGSGLGRITLPSTSGGDITTGAQRDYPITLKAGEYRYSCPLNPTPDYPLLVE